MVVVYGKNNCPNCYIIKSKMEDLSIEFEYINDDNILMKKAQELNKINKLIEMTAPLILKNGEQIKHRDIEKILNERTD